MKETTGDLWALYDEMGHTIVIPTNGTVKTDGAVVMGRGIARDARDRFPGLDRRIGLTIRQAGNVVQYHPDLRLITFPVKWNYLEEASLSLIKESAERLVRFRKLPAQVYLPRVGCGNGRRSWKDVRRILAPILDDRFTVVDYVPF